jgi:hypothetical protein
MKISQSASKKELPEEESNDNYLDILQSLDKFDSELETSHLPGPVSEPSNKAGSADNAPDNAAVNAAVNVDSEEHSHSSDSKAGGIAEGLTESAFCPNCNKPNAISSVSCKHCGSYITRNSKSINKKAIESALSAGANDTAPLAADQLLSQDSIAEPLESAAVHEASNPVFQYVAPSIPAQSERAGKARFIFGMAIFALSIVAAMGGAIYQSYSKNPQNSPDYLVQSNGQKIGGYNDEILDLVRKWSAKKPGATVDQALYGYLNQQYSRNWQPVGWMIETQSDQDTTPVVKFVWTDNGNKRNEAIWNVNMATRRIAPGNDIAKEVTK